MNKMPGLLWLKADDVAREGYDAVMKGHSVVVNGAIYRLLVWLTGAVAAQPVAAGYRAPPAAAIARPEGTPARGVAVSPAMVETLLKDVRYALRWMRRSPGFSAVAILSLGLGVGVNTAMFSLVDSLLFRPLPVTSPDTLVDVFTTGGDGDEYATNSYPGLPRSQGAEHRLQRHARVQPDDGAARPRRSVAHGRSGRSSRRIISRCSACSRSSAACCVPSDDEPGAPRVVVHLASHVAARVWQRSARSSARR